MLRNLLTGSHTTHWFLITDITVPRERSAFLNVSGTSTFRCVCLPSWGLMFGNHQILWLQVPPWDLWNTDSNSPFWVRQMKWKDCRDQLSWCRYLGINLITGWWFGICNMKFMTFHIFGMSSSQLTNSIIFQRGRSTTNQINHPEIDTNTWLCKNWYPLIKLGAFKEIP